MYKHGCPTLPEYFAVETKNEEEYRQVIQWFQTKGYLMSGLLSTPGHATDQSSVGIDPPRPPYDRGHQINNRRSLQWQDFGVKVISFDHWLRLTRQVTGYKLLKYYPNCKDEKEMPIGTIVPAAGNEDLAEWPEYYEPVYQPEFKIGDWIVARFNRDWITVEVVQVEKSVYVCKIPTDSKHFCIDRARYHEHRAATPEEIEKAKVPAKTVLTLGGGTTFEARRDIIGVYKCNGQFLQFHPYAVAALHNALTLINDEGRNAILVGAEGVYLRAYDLAQLLDAYKQHTPDWERKLKTNK